MGEPMGVAKLLLTAIIRAMQNVSGFTPRVAAVLMVMGQNRAAVAALLMNSVTNVATMQILNLQLLGECCNCFVVAGPLCLVV